VRAWTAAYLNWVKKGVQFDQPAQRATLIDYLHEVEHAQERIVRLEQAIDDVIKTIPEKMKAVVGALQSLRGIAKIAAVTIMAELGEVSRFATPRQLMGYSGAVSSEHSSGDSLTSLPPYPPVLLLRDPAHTIPLAVLSGYFEVKGLALSEKSLDYLRFCRDTARKQPS